MIGQVERSSHLIIRGANEHNLKGLSCDIPRDQLVVISGLSGSGKSTLAFDIIFSEGQRRYIECLAPYARQFLKIRSRPNVELIEGVPPTVAIEQHTSSGGRKSTIATMSGVGDFLRLLFARTAVPRCPKCKVLADQSGPLALKAWLKQRPPEEQTKVLAPIIRGRRGHHRPAIDRLQKRGIQQVRINGTYYEVDKVPSLKRYSVHDIDAVLPSLQGASLTEALDLSGGTLILQDASGHERTLSQDHICPSCGDTFARPDPRVFSFNNKAGACPHCEGYGEQSEISPSALREYKDMTVRLTVRKILPAKAFDRDEKKRIVSKLEKEGLRKFTKIRDVNETQDLLLRRTLGSLVRQALAGGELGERSHKVLSSQLEERPCQHCEGSRLSSATLLFEFQGHNIAQVESMTIANAKELFDAAKPEGDRALIARPILAELRERLSFLNSVGVGYLALDRAGPTLSGGESQRIRLAGLARSGMRGALFVLDEPSIGLHAKDSHQLIHVFRQLVDSGNGVLIVEHDEETILSADTVIDMGPGGGQEGGRIVRMCDPSNLVDSPTATGLRAPIPAPRNHAKNVDRERGIRIEKASLHNLKNVCVTFPTPSFCVVSGVSGSGKSSLVMGCLEPSVSLTLQGEKPPQNRIKRLLGVENIDRIAVVDHTPIGRTPRSTPATYVKIFDEIRRLFSLTEEARARGYSPTRFSFNSGAGRCDECAGQGQIKMEMAFLPDVYQRCHVCDGRRYNQETLDIRYGGRSIADVLELSISDAVTIFQNHPKIVGKLETMNRIGLGYLTLGQSSPTLSGGEAQRVKLAAELGGRRRERSLFLLDEPSTGLHRLDVFKLIEVLQSLVDEGHTVVVIEHHLDIISAADHVIDIGPEGGDSGGEVVAEGSPRDIVKSRKLSATGMALWRHQKSHRDKNQVSVSV